MAVGVVVGLDDISSVVLRLAGWEAGGCGIGGSGVYICPQILRAAGAVMMAMAM